MLVCCTAGAQQQNPAFITPLKGRLHVPKVSTNHLAQQCQSSCCRQPNHEWFTPLQASSRSALGWTSSRVGGGTRHASSPSRTRSSVSQRGGFSLSGTLEEGTPPVELGSSPPGGSDSRRPAWVVPGTSQHTAFHVQRYSLPVGNKPSEYSGIIACLWQVVYFQLFPVHLVQNFVLCHRDGKDG